nr:hypothetical protein [Tanacetum cinerariifolium]
NFNLESLVTYKWIAKQFVVEVLKNPKISYRQMVVDVREKFLINVSVHQCRRAKQREVYVLEGVQLDVNTLDDGKTQFRRMYICFNAIKEGWISCRRVIGLNGYFLKSTCRGELLKTMGKDSDNQMFPIAWAVVSIENSENWLWFLSNLGSDFNLAMGVYLTILLDGHKGLSEAVKELLPYAVHILCARHIYANFKKKWNGLHYKDPKAWCRAYFQMDRSCAAFENGISESYHSAIGIARTKPIISMLEEIRVYLMQKIVFPYGHQLFEVRKANEGFGVNLNTKTCTCKRWNLSGIPCIHAMAAYCMLNQDPGKGVSSWRKIITKQDVTTQQDQNHNKSDGNLSMGAEITDVEIAALADMNEVEERKARRKDVERVHEEARKMGVYRKRGAGGWRGPSKRIENQRRKKKDPNGPGKKTIHNT